MGQAGGALVSGGVEGCSKVPSMEKRLKDLVYGN